MIQAISTHRLPDETIREAAGYVADNLRQADEDEVWAMLGVSPQQALPASLAGSSQSWVLMDGSSLPIGLMGVAPTMLPNLGNPWLVGTDAVTADAISFARQTPKYVAKMHEEYRVLTNFVDARNEKAIDWLLFAGFHLIDADLRHGPEERLFFQFSRSR